jgi:hypothetical protein
MKADQDQFIGELLSLTDKAIEAVKGFRNLPLKDLNHKSSPDAWSALECIEHLNLYGNFYLPEIEKQLLNSAPAEGPRIYKSGLVGDYFVTSIQAGNGKKMKSPREMDATNSTLSITTIDRFLKQLDKLKILLHESRKADLARVKTAISLTRLIKLRLGDTFRFLVYHNERHILQAQRAIS